jgi:2-(1,2-epoxy-1,2-dihydrophenyl)acetyl-CoA isomerase
MEFKHLLLQIESGVAKLSLNRPETLNSFNEAMHLEMHAALDAIANDKSIRALLLTGEGRGFCAGQDLSDPLVKPAEQMPDLGEVIGRYYNPMLSKLSQMAIPTICAVNGIAAGAGANIPLACDFVIAARSAKFIQAFCKIGLIPDSGGTWFLPRLVGMARAKQLAMLGEPLKAEQALEWGLIYKVVDDENLQDEATNFAKHLATQPTQGLALTKQALQASQTNTLEEQLLLEQQLQQVAGNSYDYKEGVMAFIEKRPAEYKGE